MSVTSLGMALDQSYTVRLWPSRSENWACLAIDGNEASYEIRMERPHVEALRDQAPNVLAGLDLTAAEDAACEHAENAGQHATDAAAHALDLAAKAEAAGADEAAAFLREAATKATEAADKVDATVRAFTRAAEEADLAMSSLLYLTGKAEEALRRPQEANRPAELITS